MVDYEGLVIGRVTNAEQRPLLSREKFINRGHFLVEQVSGSIYFHQDSNEMSVSVSVQD